MVIEIKLALGSHIVFGYWQLTESIAHSNLVIEASLALGMSVIGYAAGFV